MHFYKKLIILIDQCSSKIFNLIKFNDGFIKIRYFKLNKTLYLNFLKANIN